MRLAVAAGADHTTVHGNRAAFRTLARWMNWLAESKASEHYEMHIPWHLESPYRKGTKVMVQMPSRGKASRPAANGFELTFIVVTESELDAMFPRPRRRAQRAKPKTQNRNPRT